MKSQPKILAPIFFAMTSFFSANAQFDQSGNEYVSNDDIRINGYLRTYDGNDNLKLFTSDANKYSRIQWGDDGDDRLSFYFDHYNGGTASLEVMSLLGNGNVGIGTTSPGRPLEVAFSGNDGASFISNNADALLEISSDANNIDDNADSFIFLKNNNNVKWMLGNDENGPGDNAFTIAQSSFGNPSFVIKQDGNIGIGNTDPKSNLHISSNGDAILKIEADTDNTDESDNARIEFSQDNSVVTGFIGFEGNAGTTSPNTFANALLIGSEDTGSRPIQFINQDAVQMTINSVGVGIGTASTFGYKLAVAGKIITEEVKVKLQSTGWPDYVFSKNYKLQSLTETESYIKKEGHLPNIPSAQEVAENGIELGEMNAKLLEKIEELTLHLINQQKEIEALKIEVKNIKK